jgi:hypothetical protein
VPARPAPAPDAPSASITTLADGASYTHGQTVLASYSCQHPAGAPGIASCTATVSDGAPIDTAAPGQHTFTLTATSKDGQSTVKTVTYTILPPSTHITIQHVASRPNGVITLQVKVPGRIDMSKPRGTTTSNTTACCCNPPDTDSCSPAPTPPPPPPRPPPRPQDPTQAPRPSPPPPTRTPRLANNRPRVPPL